MINNVQIYMKRLREDAILPKYAHGTEDSGMDVFAAAISVKEDGEWKEYSEYTIKPNKTVLVKTGFAYAIPEGTEFQARPTSGNSLKTMMRVANAPGTLDAGYRNEIGIILTNTGDTDFTIHKNDKVAQIVLCPVLHAVIELTDTLPESVRGLDGYGSTGVMKDTNN